MMSDAYIDYNAAWAQWDDMIKYSPAPFHRRRLIMRLMQDISFESAIDVGCGNGELLLTIEKRYPHARLLGIDVSTHIIASNRRQFPRMSFYCVDIGVERLSEQSDLVVCSEVLEHIADARQAMLHLRQMCKRYLILTVPCGKVFPIDRAVGHFRHFSAQQMAELLRKQNFEPECLWEWGFPFHTLYKYGINLAPQFNMRQFAAGRYSLTQKILATFLIWLFYANACRFGTQLLVRAKAI